MGSCACPRFGTLAPASFFGFLLLVSAATAHAGDWYAGADVATRIIYTDGNYATDHLRLKGGYQVSRPIAVEVQVMNGGSDSDLGFEGYRQWSAGPSYGFFIKPSHAFHRNRVEVYGLAGATRMETAYRFASTGIVDKDRIWSGAAGAGMQYNFASGLSASVDVLWTFGEAKYPHLYNPTGSTSESVITGTVAVGLNYKF